MFFNRLILAKVAFGLFLLSAPLSKVCASYDLAPDDQLSRLPVNITQAISDHLTIAEIRALVQVNRFHRARSFSIRQRAVDRRYVAHGMNRQKVFFAYNHPDWKPWEASGAVTPDDILTIHEMYHHGLELNSPEKFKTSARVLFWAGMAGHERASILFSGRMMMRMPVLTQQGARVAFDAYFGFLTKNVPAIVQRLDLRRLNQTLVKDGNQALEDAVEVFLDRIFTSKAVKLEKTPWWRYGYRSDEAFTSLKKSMLPMIDKLPEEEAKAFRGLLNYMYNVEIARGLILDRYIDQDLFGLVYDKPEHFDNPALESYLPEDFQALKNSPSFRNIIAKFVLLYTTTTGNEVTTMGDEITARSTNDPWTMLASSMRPNPLNRHYLSHPLFREERINNPFAPEKSLVEELENRDFSILLGANLISASPTIRLRYDSDDYHIFRVLNPLPVHVYERSSLREVFMSCLWFYRLQNSVYDDLDTHHLTTAYNLQRVHRLIFSDKVKTASSHNDDDVIHLYLLKEKDQNLPG